MINIPPRIRVSMWRLMHDFLPKETAHPTTILLCLMWVLVNGYGECIGLVPDGPTLLEADGFMGAR